jgi:hypothetical protein
MTCIADANALFPGRQGITDIAVSLFASTLLSVATQAAKSFDGR